MTTALLAIPVMLFSMGFGWRRLGRRRSEHRSVETYGRALDRLGGVTRRSDAGAPVHVPDPDEAGRPHLGPASPATRNTGSGGLGSSTAPTAPPLAAPKAGRLVFGDDDSPIGPVAAASPEYPGIGATPVVAGVAERATRVRRPPTIPRPEQAKRARLVALVAAALVVVAAGIVGLTQLMGPSAKTSNGAGPATTTTAPTVVRHPTTTVLVGLPPVLTPSGSTATTVSYDLPISGPYRVGFSTSGRCWVGVQSGVGGPYLWMQTFGTGESGSYAATGTVAVRIGAPGVVTITVNGTPVSLPAGRTQPYDVVLDERG